MAAGLLVVTHGSISAVDLIQNQQASRKKYHQDHPRAGKEQHPDAKTYEV
jgi:hypothetical protein